MELVADETEMLRQLDDKSPEVLLSKDPTNVQQLATTVANLDEPAYETFLRDFEGLILKPRITKSSVAQFTRKLEADLEFFKVDSSIVSTIIRLCTDNIDLIRTGDIVIDHFRAARKRAMLSALLGTSMDVTRQPSHHADKIYRHDGELSFDKTESKIDITDIMKDFNLSNENIQLTNEKSEGKSGSIFDVEEGSVVPSKLQEMYQQAVENFVEKQEQDSLSALPDSPFKIVISNLDPLATQEDIKRSFKALIPEKDIEVIKAERFVETIHGQKEYMAFVHLSTYEDAQMLLSDDIKAFGIHINGVRCPILSVSTKKVLVLYTNITTKAVLEKLLVTWHIPAYKMIGVDEEDHIRSSVRLMFDNHEKAYEAKKIFNEKLKSPIENLPRRARMAVQWGKNNSSSSMRAMQETQKELKKENEKLKKVISKYSLASAIANTTDDLKFSAVQYNHLMKVLEIANGDVEEGARLLGMSKAQLRRTARQLAKEGFDTSRIINNETTTRATSSM
jgi:hypothetical protein